MTMTPTPLDNTPRIGMGCWAIGGPWEYGWGPQDDDASIRTILAAIDRLQPGGSTNAEEGLLLAYEMARRYYQPGAIQEQAQGAV